MIPTCLNLDQRQIDKLERFRKFIIEKHGEENWDSACLEEDCTGASPMKFKIYSTGIGDVIWVSSFGYECGLSIGDDGELFPDDFKKKK